MSDETVNEVEATETTETTEQVTEQVTDEMPLPEGLETAGAKGDDNSQYPSWCHGRARGR
jgi:hypothetical protein